MIPTNWYSIWHIFWHSIRHSFWHIYIYILAYLAFCLAFYLISDILSGVLSDIALALAVGARQCHWDLETLTWWEQASCTGLRFILSRIEKPVWLGPKTLDPIQTRWLRLVVYIISLVMLQFCFPEFPNKIPIKALGSARNGASASGLVAHS